MFPVLRSLVDLLADVVLGFRLLDFGQLVGRDFIFIGLAEKLVLVGTFYFHFLFPLLSLALLGPGAFSSPSGVSRLLRRFLLL